MHVNSLELAIPFTLSRQNCALKTLLNQNKTDVVVEIVQRKKRSPLLRGAIIGASERTKKFSRLSTCLG